MLNFLADVIPAASPGTLAELVIGGAVILYFVDRIVSIATNLRGAKADVMPRKQSEAEFSRLEKAISEVRNERREVSKELFDKVDALSHSISNSMSDVSRALGRLEGGQQLAESIQSAIVTIAKNHQS